MDRVTEPKYTVYYGVKDTERANCLNIVYTVIYYINLNSYATLMYHNISIEIRNESTSV